MDSPESGTAEGAFDLFAAWLARRERGESAEFDELVRGHPRHADELAQYHEDWKRMAVASDLSNVSLPRDGDASPAPGSGFPAELIAKLSEHSARFGRYEIRGEVARGGMGAILRIWDDQLRRDLAMKVILGQAELRASGKTPPVTSSRVARFLEEAQVTGQLDHPGIVPVHELGLDPQGRLYFTMKLVQGESLQAVFEHARAGRMDWTQSRVLHVLLKVCEAMAYAHDKGVIHRDLKPANVMVGGFGEVYVMDWGLARILGQQDRKDIRIREPVPRTSVPRKAGADQREELPDSPLCTMDGDVVGTPAYMPPEQAEGRVAEVGPHSDVYSVGAMLYHLVAGHAPYRDSGVRLDNREVWARVREGPPARIEALAPDVAPELAAICERAMARDWKRRYRDMSELAADLSAFLNQRVVRAYETGTWAESRKWVRRNKPLAVSLAGAIVLLAAGLSASLVFKGRADEKAALAAAEGAKAQAEKANVLKLSGFQTLDDLTREADELWPAEPGPVVERCRAWLKRAEALVARLPEFRAALAEIEQRALPQGEEERAWDRSSHPRARELEAKRAQQSWMKRMLGEERWPDEAALDPALSGASLTGDPVEWNDLAWELVNPEGPAYGSEGRALVLARRAVDRAGASERPALRDTLAWACFMSGRFDEALAEERRALEDVGSARHEDYLGYAKKLELAIDRWRDRPGTAADPLESRHGARLKECEGLAREIAALEAETSKRRSWRFAEGSGEGETGDRWWHDQMSKLVAALEAFADPDVGLLLGTSEAHGWGVEKRMQWAAQVEEHTPSGPEAGKRWQDAIRAIADSPKYGGLKLAPQFGLVPIGADPQSGLWEFAHLQTGEPAIRGADGKLAVTEAMGLVFVLLPGGTYWMGAQATDPNGRNYDPQALPDEAPVHEVTLSPFLLSKYEMTQGQWLRSTGRNPAFFGPSAQFNGHHHDLTHPVEQVSWTQCATLMQRLGLELPSESEWEYGCRGGRPTPWWTGTTRESLRGQVNMADKTAALAGFHLTGSDDWPDLVDGWVVHAPVGSLPANPYGLHEVMGNVWEWCRGTLVRYSTVLQVDPETRPGAGTPRVDRGASFDFTASWARSACRDAIVPEARYRTLGLRPGMRIRP